MKNAGSQNSIPILCELLNSMHELVLSNLKELKFNDKDAMMVSILLRRYCKTNEPSVSEWIEKCEQSDKQLMKKNSSDLLKTVFQNMQRALSQSITIVKGKEVTINKNYANDK